MPQTSNPSSRDLALMSAEVSMSFGGPKRAALHVPRRVALHASRGPCSAGLSGPRSGFSHQLPQHIRKNAAVAERDELLRRVDTHECRKFDRRVALAVRANDDGPAGTQALRDAGQVVALAAGEPERGGR